MKQTAKFLLCSAALMGLAGCNSLLADLGLAPRSANSTALASTEGQSRLEMGRAALKAGAPGNAIYHFERAILDPAQAPEAYNGMGVAYAQLGRQDLAERFFTAALMLQPKDERFLRNLARLDGGGANTFERALADANSVRSKNKDQADAELLAAGVAQQFANQPSSAIDDRGRVIVDGRRQTSSRSSRQELLLPGAQPSIIEDSPSASVQSSGPDIIRGETSPVSVQSSSDRRTPKVSAVSDPLGMMNFAEAFRIFEDPPESKKESSRGVRVSFNQTDE